MEPDTLGDLIEAIGTKIAAKAAADAPPAPEPDPLDDAAGLVGHTVPTQVTDMLHDSRYVAWQNARGDAKIEASIIAGAFALLGDLIKLL